MSPALLHFFEWLNGTPLAEAIRLSTWWYPILEAVHSLGVIVVLGSIWMLDLRLLGVGMRSRRVSEIAGRLLPWTWSGFGVQALSGSLLLVSEATRLYSIPYFWIKLVLLALAAVNALVFHLGVYRGVGGWDEAPATPFAAKVAGAVSLTLWVGVVAAGRAIGYVT
ncbi:MAG: hypothetical protein JO323_18835 [Acidobacteriia bacterium]|nr:hypothetical protein [Terriglobia bacterium]